MLREQSFLEALEMLAHCKVVGKLVLFAQHAGLFSKYACLLLLDLLSCFLG